MVLSSITAWYFLSITGINYFWLAFFVLSFAIFFIAEYTNMILLSCLASIMFLGGWLAPLKGLDFIPGWMWLFVKTAFVVSLFVWFRASFPRYRYDQIMRLGWKIFIPLTLVWVIVLAAWVVSPLNIWKG